MEPSQLPLRIGLRDSATFDNFVPGPNAAAVNALRGASEPFVYLWGASGTGKTHLLEALCHEAASQEKVPAYLPLQEHAQLAPEVCEGLENMPLVCLDDVQAIACDQAWEHALFHLYNRIRDAGGQLVVTSDAPPAGLALQLPDLRSRLGWGPVFHLHGLDDELKVEALRLRAEARGMELSPEVAGYLIRRCARDAHALFALLDRLDRASLVAQRRLTIPFVRNLLDA